jgi:hypothetical protein
VDFFELLLYWLVIAIAPRHISVARALTFILSAVQERVNTLMIPKNISGSGQLKAGQAARRRYATLKINFQLLTGPGLGSNPHHIRRGPGSELDPKGYSTLVVHLQID